MLVDEAQFGTQQTAALGFIQAVDIQYLAVSCRVVDMPGGRSRRPESMFSSVLLPEPDSPTMPRTSPGHRSSETSLQPMRLP